MSGTDSRQGLGRIAIVFIGMAIVALVVVALFPMVNRHYKINDAGTGLSEYVRNEFNSEIKEGYLLRRDKKTYWTSRLGRRSYIGYQLYQGPSTADGYFEVYSDKEQPNACQQVGTKLVGPKIRLDTCSKDIGMLNGLVRYIGKNLGPVGTQSNSAKTAKEIK